MTTAVITIREGEHLSDADIDMRLAGIRHLPVVDDRNHLVGILSNRDLLRALGRGNGKSVEVYKVMTKRVRTVEEETPAHEAAAMMIEHKIGALPVMGDRGQLVGLLTETDFVRFAHDALREAN